MSKFVGFFLTLVLIFLAQGTASLAQLPAEVADFGIGPVGPRYTFEDEDVEHIGKPLAEADN